MKRSILIFISFFFCVTTNAQKVWTLQECIDYAMEHNVNILQSQLSQQNAEYQYKMTKNSWLPSLSASASENFGFGQSPSATGVYVQNNSSSSSFGLNLQMPVFQGLNIYNSTKADNLSLQATIMDMEQAKNDLSLNIVAYYMQVIFNKELLATAQHQVELSQAQYDKTKELAIVGKIPEADVYESAAQVATDQSSLTEARNNLMLSILDLTQALEINEVEDFDVVSPEAFNKEETVILALPETTFRYAVEHQPVMEAARLRLEKTHFDLKASKSSWYPSLSFYAGYSNGYYHYYTDGYPNESFSNQLGNNGRTQVGLSLNIPIFNSMRTKYTVEMTKLSVKNQELLIDNESKTLKKEIQQAYYNALASEQKYEAAKNTLQASQIAYEYSQAGFDAGKTTLLELNESKTRLFKSESSMLQAKYEYMYRCRVLDFYNGEDFVSQ